MDSNEKGFINEPKTLEDYKHNVSFQLANVNGWISVGDYDCALIKTRCLNEALENLAEFQNKQNNKKNEKK